jgi:hypothetical protein
MQKGKVSLMTHYSLWPRTVGGYLALKERKEGYAVKTPKPDVNAGVNGCSPLRGAGYHEDLGEEEERRPPAS